jgi:hypothetical protein
MEQCLENTDALVERQLAELGVGGADLAFLDFVQYQYEGASEQLVPRVEGTIGSCNVSWLLWGVCRGTAAGGEG